MHVNSPEVKERYGSKTEPLLQSLRAGANSGRRAGVFRLSGLMPFGVYAKLAAVSGA
ncbi:MAG: hypothetical protein M3R15_16205 [Acidobacteriota bacterium]|nr:hypothetical protein [Acidobacteriota bacterium]